MKTWILGGVAAVVMLGAAVTARADEPYCREFQRKVTIGGKIQESYGTACMQPDGAWKVMSEGSDLGEPIQVTQQVITQPVVQQIVYEEPLYVQRQVAYRPYYGPALGGLSFNWSSGDGWRDGGRGHYGHRGWDGHRGHGHGRH